MNQPTLTRRSLLSAAAIAAVSPMFPAARTLAMEPIKRTGRQHLKLSLAAYSMRKYLGAAKDSADAMDMLGFIDWAATLNLDSVELTSYWIPDPPTPEYLAQIKQHCHLHGLNVSGGAIRNNFTLPAGDELEKWFKHVESWVEYYAAIGAPVIRIFAGVPPKGTSDEEGIARAIPNIERACDIAGKRGIMLGLENHDYLTNIDRLMPIIEAVKSPWFGVNLDTGNFNSPDPYIDIERVAPYAVNVQVKAEIHRTGKPKEPADLKRVVKILKDSGYSGPLALEYEAEEEPRTAIPRLLDELRSYL
ncbi:MAG: TIM barrel protein [Planctomycetes bacterium]|nr:TIM barrel protein [Planctomycetota bacterium]